MLSAVLAIAVLSVLLSVCPFVCQTRALWLNEQTFRQYFNTTWKAILSSFENTENGWWRTIPCTWNVGPKWPTYFKTSSRGLCAIAQLLVWYWQQSTDFGRIHNRCACKPLNLFTVTYCVCLSDKAIATLKLCDFLASQHSADRRRCVRWRTPI